MDIPLCRLHAPCQLIPLSLHGHQLGSELLRPLAVSCHGLLRFLLLLLGPGFGFCQKLHILTGFLRCCRQLLQHLLMPLAIGLALAAAFFQHLDFAVCRLNPAVDFTPFGCQCLQLLFQLQDFPVQPDSAPLNQLHGSIRRQLLVFLFLYGAIKALPAPLQLQEPVVQPCQLEAFQLPLQFLMPCRLLRADSQGLQLVLNLPQDIVDTLQVAFRIIQLPHGFLLAVPVLGNPCRFLKEQSLFLRPGIEDFIHLVLADDAHAVMTDAGIRKKIGNILQAAARLIDVKLTFTCPKQPPGYHYLMKIHRQAAIIIKIKGNLCHTHLPPGFAARKDDVLRLDTPEIADILLPQHPFYRIRNIALAAAIWPHNSRNSLIKLNLYLISEGLKAIRLQLLQLQTIHQPAMLYSNNIWILF